MSSSAFPEPRPRPGAGAAHLGPEATGPGPAFNGGVSLDAASLRPPSQDVVGISLALTDYHRTMDWMDALVRERGKAIVTAAAVHLVMVAREDAATRAAISEPHVLAVPDGQPLVWAQKALGHRDASRVYGPELMAKYLERVAIGGHGAES
jgi:N-acetylglucosaminyldiphosphoundecaprenol N-acetyl-beta-D-mannosaminyltransferase